MSATVTMTMPPAAQPTTTMMTSTLTSSESSSCCPNCGLNLPSSISDPHAALIEAQKQIDDLQAQVRLLNQKAAAAVDRWADYEDELAKLRAAMAPNNNRTPGPRIIDDENVSPRNTANNNNNDNRPITPNPNASTSSPRGSFLLPMGAASRLSALLSRKSTPNLKQPPNAAGSGGLGSSFLSSPPVRHARAQSTVEAHSSEDLAAALAREKKLRAAAEGKLNDTSREVEELSVTLFEQANEMVASERRARASLEERVSLLEKRDGEKRDRLQRLEGAMGRIERVRNLLDEEQ
ncbi:hypothetical protein F4780DRAFT_715131 [Xylariomycetidae sp. FL0641]|nr:hypothetical protein F4780DRAFT_715131 [Xylariomycetidae sp. FL0641]